MKPDKKVKILATLGPTTRSIDDVRALVPAGVNPSRLNFRHGDPADHPERFAWLREVDREPTHPNTLPLGPHGPTPRAGPSA